MSEKQVALIVWEDKPLLPEVQNIIEVEHEEVETFKKKAWWESIPRVCPTQVKPASHNIMREAYRLGALDVNTDAPFSQMR